MSVLAFGGCKLTSDPPVAHILAITSGNAQTAAAGTALPSPLGVVVIDQYGSAMPTVTVTWAITAGAGSLSATSTPTDASGTASVTYTAGPTAGAATITAAVAGIGTVAFSETIT
jgi:hypothetical protein